MDMVQKVTQEVQDLFVTEAAQVARDTGFCQRSSKLGDGVFSAALPQPEPHQRVRAGVLRHVQLRGARPEELASSNTERRERVKATVPGRDVPAGHRRRLQWSLS